ncbi:hypothetical protein GJ496_009610 [Pomphorhynchus laevis]|nr:hypothetical protein GJ496_009610 [Pomphorhynchus laevis]
MKSKIIPLLCRKVPICKRYLSNAGSDNTFTSYEVIPNLHETWKFVERLMHLTTVPPVPEHKTYPTPSGWKPAMVKDINIHGYLVERTRNHQLPLYVSYKDKLPHREDKILKKGEDPLNHMNLDYWEKEPCIKMIIYKETKLRQAFK